MIIRSDKFIANPTVTCSIIVYNQKKWIGQCIDGMLEQVCDFPFNIVISDDCSTDGTQEVLKDYQARYPEKIKLVLNEKNGGIGANWATCCKALEGGEYVAFCDGDDFWSLPNKLQTQYDYMRAHQECVGTTTGCDTMDENNVVYSDHTKYDDNPNPRIITQQQIWTEFSNINMGGVFFKKSIFDKHMPFDAFIEYGFPLQDWPAMLIMAGYGEIHFLPIFSFTYRLGHVSDAHPQDFGKLERKMLRGKKMYQYLHSLFPTLPYNDAEYDRYANKVLLQFCIRSGNYPMAKKYAKLCDKKTVREYCCSTYLTFQMYRGMKKMSKSIRSRKSKKTASKPNGTVIQSSSN